VEAERPALDVQIGAVRVLVVGDVEVDSSVVVEIREDGAERVVVGQMVEADVVPDLLEMPAAEVEEQLVADT
jgi:hypothetical protein